MVDNGGIWNEQSFKDFEAARDADNFSVRQAAPQMLAALERLCEVVKVLAAQVGTSHDKITITEADNLLHLQNEVLSALGQAEAAIAAAKG